MAGLRILLITRRHLSWCSEHTCTRNIAFASLLDYSSNSVTSMYSECYSHSGPVLICLDSVRGAPVSTSARTGSPLRRLDAESCLAFRALDGFASMVVCWVQCVHLYVVCWVLLRWAVLVMLHSIYCMAYRFHSLQSYCEQGTRRNVLLGFHSDEYEYYVLLWRELHSVEW
jgi:hypothetical protein